MYTMSIISARTGDLASGIALRTTLDGEFIRSYVVVSPPDLNVIADIVPREEVEAGGEIHATAVSDPTNVQSSTVTSFASYPCGRGRK